MAYQDLGRQKLLGVCEALKDIAFMEGYPRMEGRMMGILMAPGKKKGPAKVVTASRPADSGETKGGAKADAKPAAVASAEPTGGAEVEVKPATEIADSVSS